MIERACDDPLLLFGWVTGDEAYGDNPRLRCRCAGRGENYLLLKCEAFYLVRRVRTS